MHSSTNHSGYGWLGAIAGFGVMIMPLGAIAQSPTALDAATQQAMVDAINDEYHARAYYSVVLKKFGAVRPFSNIVQAEDRHVQLWNTLFAKYGLPVPQDGFQGKLAAPNTLLEACQTGVDAEKANVQMYDRFLGFVQQPDLRAAFTQLRQVSQNNHLPAFERCVSRGGTPAPGPGNGMGRGRNGTR